MYDYQQNYSQQAAEREKAVYESMLAQYNALLYASDEGVFEVTIRSQSGAVTIPVNLLHGTQLTQDLIEGFSRRIDKLQSNLNATIEEIGLETRSKTTRKAREEAEREAVMQRNRVAYADLAQQVAVPEPVTFNTKTRKPRPETMKAVGGRAAQVPMNQATNLPSA